MKFRPRPRPRNLPKPGDLAARPEGSTTFFARPGEGGEMTEAERHALISPPEKSWVKSTVVLEGAILTGGTAQRGWLAEDGVWPAGEKARHAWDHWDGEDRATEREGLKKP